ncbi:MAG: UDP-N-acetylglucosamine 4,6-dehydratase (inverting) [Melioribacteraceae bacterium]|nr:UDP-N-acetylglucosamine 4,6-dehydratase (inverting) [Melioribacteraceae bacterium]
MNNKTLLITGGTGSFGKKFISTVLKKHTPKKIIIYSRDELKQFEMQNNSEYSKPDVLMRYFIGDVRDKERLIRAMEGVDIVVHAAALKQVPAAEYNPFEAVKTNIMGGQNVIDACFESGIKKVIALSTDKAAAPINLYGATKLTSDKLFIAANNYRGTKDIKFSVVRYGNVMGSRGSVIPFFQMKRKEGVLPITDDRMTRFNITLQEGVDFVLNCFDVMWGGELFVPKIPSYNIVDVAKAVAPECRLEIVGIRPGEKVHEEMITEADAMNTIEFDNYYVILPSAQLGLAENLKLWDTEKFRKESSGKEGKICDTGFKYNSGTNKDFLTVDDIKKLIDEHVE